MPFQLIKLGTISVLSCVKFKLSSMKNYYQGSIRMLIMAGLVALAGCNKDDASPIHETELTRGTGKWKLTALSVTAQGQTGDAYADLEECNKDDIFYFNTNGTYQYQSGDSKCDASEPDIFEEGTWEINGKNLTIEITGDGPETVEIKLLNSTTLKTKLAIDFFGVSAIINSTYTKQ